MLEIQKSSRHQKIIGNFGEALLCNWLSRSGFEVAIVDHTGIDIVAYHPTLKKRLGITVKSRTRTKRVKGDSVNIFSYQRGKNDREKVLRACEAFGCEPWIAIYVEWEQEADLFLLSLIHYDERYRGKEGRAMDYWKMGKKSLEEYEKDQEVRHIHMSFSSSSWNWSI